jgi:F420-dependent methylenetetrahydromethanopterin dehydrogenase
LYRNTFSDRRLKTNISDIPEDALRLLMRLRPTQYRWKSTGRPDVGFIAQELRQILPGLVHEGNDDMKTLTVDYPKLVVYLTKALQQQQLKFAAQAEAQAAEMLKLKKFAAQAEAQAAEMLKLKKFAAQAEAQAAEMLKLKQAQADQARELAEMKELMKNR